MRPVTTTCTLLLLAVGCAPPGPASRDAKAVAEELFRIARSDEPSAADLARLVAGDDTPESRAALRDALTTLTGIRNVTVVPVDLPGGTDEAFADVVAELEGGGTALYNLRLREEAPGTWRVTWFQGPGVEWPPPRPRPGDSLSTSLPPDPDATR